MTSGSDVEDIASVQVVSLCNPNGWLKLSSNSAQKVEKIVIVYTVTIEWILIRGKDRIVLLRKSTQMKRIKA